MIITKPFFINSRECIRTLKFNESKLKPFTNLHGNSQIIRTSLFNEEKDLFFTFGEAGIISIWKEGMDEANAVQSKQLKEDSSVKKNLKKKAKPY